MRVALLANSQGTAAGVEAGENYPAVLRRSVASDHEVHLFAFGGWTVGDFNAHLGTIADVEPELAIVQIGIVEAALRILSPREKELLRALGRVGRFVTGRLHGRRTQVIRARRRLRLDTRLYDLEQFDREVALLVSKLRAARAEPVLLEIPQFSRAYAAEHYPFMCEDVERFNAVLRRHGALPFIETEADDGLWQPGTVHFTTRGHALAAGRIREVVAASSGAAALRGSRAAT